MSKQVLPCPPVTLETVFTATRATPIPPTTPLLDALWWATAQQRADEQRARVAVSRMESRSYWAAFGQSPREDFHAAYADLYGLEPVTGEAWTNSYTDYLSLSFRLNHVEDANAGLTQTSRQMKVLTSEPYTHSVWTLKDLAVSQQCLVAIAESFRALVGYAPEIRPIPEWRTEVVDGVRMARRQVLVTKQRPSEVVYVEVEQPLPKDWRNPFQLEDGMLLLRTAQGRSFSEENTEGLSVIFDRHARLHLVHWITKRTRCWAKGRHGYYWRSTQRPVKVPLHVRSYSLDATEDEALEEMVAVAQAMERTVRIGEQDSLLPTMAAALADDEVSVSVPTITGSDDWLQRVAEQRASNQTYRSRGHGPDSDD